MIKFLKGLLYSALLLVPVFCIWYGVFLMMMFCSMESARGGGFGCRIMFPAVYASNAAATIFALILGILICHKRKVGGWVLAYLVSLLFIPSLYIGYIFFTNS